jgi:hypothetical protein
LNMYSFLHPIQSFSGSPALVFPCVVDLGHSSRGTRDGSPLGCLCQLIHGKLSAMQLCSFWVYS